MSADDYFARLLVRGSWNVDEDAIEGEDYQYQVALAQLDELREASLRIVPNGWDGLMMILDEVYPETVFPTRDDDPVRDDGARIVSLLRLVDRLRRECFDLLCASERGNSMNQPTHNTERQKR